MINRFCCAMLAGTVSLCGCATEWRPSNERVTQASAAQPFDIRPYLEAARRGYWVYDRTDIGASQGRQPATYRRHCETDRFSEGELVDKPFLPLKRYLPDSPAATQPTKSSSLPQPPMGYRAAFLLELVDPLEPIPLNLQSDAPSVASTQIRYYWRDGRLLGEGELTRTIQVEGYEDVVCPAGRFDHCLRLRLDLSVRFPLGFTFEWTAYGWFSPEVGEVRRVQSVTGWILIIPFHSAQEFLLKTYSLPGEMTLTDVAPQWEYGAVEFDRGIPRPRISGMVIDYAKDE